MHRRATKGRAALYIHALILRNILRGILAEVSQVVVELHGEVATYGRVPCILRGTEREKALGPGHGAFRSQGQGLRLHSGHQCGTTVGGGRASGWARPSVLLPLSP